MKQTQLCKHASMLALMAAASGATLAQSTVSVYGRFNTTVEKQTTGDDSVWRLQNNSSRLGFRGTEDLGGGLKAGFQLEHGFASDTGAAASTFWGRQSELNLGGSFGLIRVGTFTSEAYYATADWVSNHNHDTGTSSDALYAYLGRNSNKLAYRLPTLVADLSVEAAVSLAEAAPGAKKNFDFAANYVIGGLQLGLGFEQADSATADKSQFALRAQYTLGPVTFGGYVQRDENAYGVGKRTNVRLSGMYGAGDWEFHLNAGRAGRTGTIADSEASQYAVGVNYKLSKRTKVYGFVTQVSDGAAALYGGDFRSVAMGVRHNF